MQERYEEASEGSQGSYGDSEEDRERARAEAEVERLRAGVEAIERYIREFPGEGVEHGSEADQG